MAEIKKCAFCGTLFQSLGTNLCPKCSEQTDRDFIKVREYIYDTSGDVSVQDIAENTGVAEKTVLYFVKQGRLSQKKVLSEGSLKCAACGAPIRSGKLCAACAKAWAGETGRSRHEADRADTQDGQRAHPKMHTYDIYDD